MMNHLLLIVSLIITTSASAQNGNVSNVLTTMGDYKSVSHQTLRFEELSEVRKLKRGKDYSIKWSGGLLDQMVKIELHNRAGKVQSWEETQNDGKYVLKLNSKLKIGKGYVFKISTDGEEVSSHEVQIIRKIPLALTISTAIVVPAIVLLVSTKDEEKEIIDPMPPDIGN